MNRLDARKEKWQAMEIKCVSGYFCDYRIDRNTVPDNFHFWELADGDSDGIPCRYKSGIFVNFYGTFITTAEMPVDDAEYNEGFFNEDEYGFLDGHYYSMDEIIKIEKSCFSGCNIVVTGKLENFTRDSINNKIVSLGATASRTVTKTTNYLICGEKPGSKLTKAKELGIPVLTEQQFLDMIFA